MSPDLILLIAIGAVLLLVAVGVWRLIASWGGQKATTAKATQAEEIARRSLEAMDRAEEAQRERRPRGAAALRRWLRGE